MKDSFDKWARHMGWWALQAPLRGKGVQDRMLLGSGARRPCAQRPWTALMGWGLERRGMLCSLRFFLSLCLPDIPLAVPDPKPGAKELVMCS